jgi:hypothetical protein
MFTKTIQTLKIQEVSKKIKIKKTSKQTKTAKNKTNKSYRDNFHSLSLQHRCYLFNIFGENTPRWLILFTTIYK